MKDETQGAGEGQAQGAPQEEGGTEQTGDGPEEQTVEETTETTETQPEDDTEPVPGDDVETEAPAEPLAGHGSEAIVDPETGRQHAPGETDEERANREQAEATRGEEPEPV